MNTLAAQELSAGYGNRRVLDAVSMAARAGEVLVLLGPNGAGKTTLLRALARLLRPSQGTVVFQGRDVWDQRPHEVAREIAMTPQQERRDWPLTVEESVLLGRAPHRGWMLPYTTDDRQIVQQALENCGLLSLRERPITELSGGEWRRMILARALAQEAKVLLLDEPTAGLDFKYQLEVLLRVRQLAAEQQLIVVLTLHDLNYASLYGDRLALLADHKIVAIGSADEVLTADLIRQAFGVPVMLIKHPLHGTPMVMPLTEHLLERHEPSESQLPAPPVRDSSRGA